MTGLLCTLAVIFTATFAAEPCATPDSKTGECVEVENCPQFKELEDWSRETLRLRRLSQCGFKGTTPCVCCPKDDTPRPFVAPERAQTPMVLASRLGTQEKCGKQYPGDRIFDGTITDFEEFPWMALLVYQTAQGPGLACGGVLISHKYVLTAAHCVIGPDIEKIGKLIVVRLGEYDLRTLEDCDDSEIEDYCVPPPMDIKVESTHPHPHYLPGTANRHHDIALVRLSSPVPYSKYIQPICLPNEDVSHILSSPGTPLTICGWGKTETTEGSPIKLKAKVPVVAKDKCSSPYATKGIHLGSHQVCAGGEKGDSCRGDSGGPLMYEDNSDPTETQWYSLGIISFGPNPCAKAGEPAIYTKVHPYLDWIQSNMKP